MEPEKQEEIKEEMVNTNIEEEKDKEDEFVSNLGGNLMLIVY